MHMVESYSQGPGALNYPSGYTGSCMQCMHSFSATRQIPHCIRSQSPLLSFPARPRRQARKCSRHTPLGLALRFVLLCNPFSHEINSTQFRLAPITKNLGMEPWPSSETINCSKVAREHGITAKNGGQIVKEFAAEMGLDLETLDHRQLIWQQWIPVSLQVC